MFDARRSLRRVAGRGPIAAPSRKNDPFCHPRFNSESPSVGQERTWKPKAGPASRPRRQSRIGRRLGPQRRRLRSCLALLLSWSPRGPTGRLAQPSGRRSGSCCPVGGAALSEHAANEHFMRCRGPQYFWRRRSRCPTTILLEPCSPEWGLSRVRCYPITSFRAGQ
jgi:hypothetical protein